LTGKEYGNEAIRNYLGWELRLTLSFLEGEAYTLNSRVQKLRDQVFSETCQPHKRESDGHSLSYALKVAGGVIPVALLKKSNPLIHSSFFRLLPNLGVKAHVGEYELIGFEQDQWFGFNLVPTTIAVRDCSSKSNAAEADTKTAAGKDAGKIIGTIQRFVPHSDTISSLFDTAISAHKLATIPKSHLHILSISGFFKGIAAGHLSNYICKFSKDLSKILRIHEIDLEEILLPLNQLKDQTGKEGLQIVPVEDVDKLIAQLDKSAPAYQVELDKLQKKKEMIKKSIILCRMCILGLPQNAQPFDRASLMILSHPGLSIMLSKYHAEAVKKHPLVAPEAWKAQRNRLEVMLAFAKSELSKAAVTGTPRDLYFSIFGGSHLWKIGIDRDIPDLIIANQLVSDPYQHTVKDFGDPEAIPVNKRFVEPRDSTPVAWETMNFYRLLAGLEPKEQVKPQSG
jgi:hypothetical protein